eukprot:5211592-Pyramimonas_sp.AAC.1
MVRECHGFSLISSCSRDSGPGTERERLTTKRCSTSLFTRARPLQASSCAETTSWPPQKGWACHYQLQSRLDVMKRAVDKLVKIA